MKKNLLLIASIGVLKIVGCKKENIEAPVCNNITSSPTAQSYQFPITIGSYWIYENFTMDSTNMITSTTSIDSVFIPYDTLINGKEYARKKIVNLSNNNSIPTMEIFLGSYVYARDSAGYIVNPQGKFIKHDDFNNILSFSVITNPPHTIVARMTHKDSLVTVPVGSFTTINYQQTVTIQASSYSGNRTKYNNQIMADNIGVIYQDLSFYNSPTKLGIRLLRYHIAE
jgi:hypothetical protein